MGCGKNVLGSRIFDFNGLRLLFGASVPSRIGLATVAHTGCMYGTHIVGPVTIPSKGPEDQMYSHFSYG
jgi:hypothetical protein